MTTRRTRDLVNTVSITDNPSSLQIRTDYNLDGTILYIGYAPKGTSVSDNVWTIHQFIYNVNQQQTLRQTAFDTWQDRTVALYE